MKQIVRTVLFAALMSVAFGLRAEVLVGGDDAYVAAWPQEATAGELGAAGRALRAERAELAKRAEGKLSFGDMLITVVAPGGLLYAAHKKSQAKEAAAEVARIDEDLALLEAELRRLAGRDGLVAELR